jgi:monovalent cation/hydrogen antiporter
MSEINRHENSESAQYVRHGYELQLRRAETELGGSGSEDASAFNAAEAKDYAEVIHTALEAQRRRLVGLRSDGVIGDTAFQRLEEELDWMELGWEQVVSQKPEDMSAASGTAQNAPTGSAP